MGGRRYNEQRLCGLTPQRSPHRRFTNTTNSVAKTAIVSHLASGDREGRARRV
jgi:hypothetical protein